MKTTRFIKTLACTAMCFTLFQPAQADFTSDARKVFADNAPSVFGLRGLLEITVTMNGQQAGSQERPLWSNAAVIDEGLLVVAYKSLKPDVGTNAGNRPGLEIETELSELKLIDESGEEFDAKLVLHDEVLGVAFIALDPDGGNAGDFSAKALDLSQDAEIQHLQELVGIGRMPENMRFQAQVKKGTVTAIVERPRKLVHVSGLSPSSPVFNQSGQMVGVVVVPKTKEGESPVPLLLPSKYVRNLVAQAKEKQAALAEGGDEEAPEEEGEDAGEEAEDEVGEEAAE